MVFIAGAFLLGCLGRAFAWAALVELILPVFHGSGASLVRVDRQGMVGPADRIISREAQGNLRRFEKGIAARSARHSCSPLKSDYTP